jgi:hypothetical protein
VALDSRTRFFLIALVVAVAAVVAAMVVPQSASGEPTVTLYKSPTCGCCGDWGDQMAARGFRIDNDLTPNLAPVFAEYGIAPALQSCHLAVVGDYVIVGHVPPEEVVRLLASGEDVRGLTAPGMPAGSPGMEMPDGRADPYQVLILDRDGGARPLGTFQGSTRLD